MHRQKSIGEIEQEERDAELARKLQDELNTPPIMHNVNTIHSSNNSERANYKISENVTLPVMRNGNLEIACPVCTFTNNITHPQLHREYHCYQCNSLLPVPQEYCIVEANKQIKESNNNTNQVNKTMKHQERFKQDESNQQNFSEENEMIICESCHCLNRISESDADVMLCGACYQKLNWRPHFIEEQKSSENLSPLSNSPMQEVSKFEIQSECLESQPEIKPDTSNMKSENKKECINENTNDERTIQVRCGQCGAINAVNVNTTDRSIQFLCGNCEVVNDVALN